MTVKKSWWMYGAVAGAAIGGLFHLAWHLNLTILFLSDLLWEWGGLFVNVARFELIGLHLGVLVVHVFVYAALGALVTFLLQRLKQAN